MCWEGARGPCSVNPPDAVVIPHQEDALRVRQVAVLYEQANNAPAAELELFSNDALEIRNYATCVQIHEQPAHAAINDRRRRIIKV